jgi:hypothetical protein
MLAVSWAARRWGPGIGGLLAGLPLASGPISIYLCAEQGANFAASAAGHSILSLTPVALFSLVYAVVAQRLSMPACLLSGFGVFLLVLYFLQSLAQRQSRLLVLDLDIWVMKRRQFAPSRVWGCLPCGTPGRGVASSGSWSRSRITTWRNRSDSARAADSPPSPLPTTITRSPG